MNKNLNLDNSDYQINIHSILISRIDLLSKRIRDLEVMVYGIAATYNAEGRMVATNGTPNLTRTYTSPTSTIEGDGDFIYAPSNLATQSYGDTTIHFTWSEDQYGNSVLQSTNTTTP